MFSRRQALTSGLCAAGWATLRAAAAPATGANPTRPPTASDSPPYREIAAGIFARRGLDEDVSPTNDDAIANIGFVIGADSVAVVDPGGSLRDGERLREEILRVTKRPIRFVIMTHGHPDHIFGAEAFQRDRPLFVGHSRLPLTLAARGDYYRRHLDEVLGAGRAGAVAPRAGAVAPRAGASAPRVGDVIPPTRLVEHTATLDLGGRTLELTAWPRAHSDCDLTVRDPQTSTLFAGDLLFVDRVPSLDGSLRGWMTALNSLKSVKASRAVPGHGPVGVDWPSGSTDLERYLGVLAAGTRVALANKVDLDAAVQTVGKSERGRWKLFDAYHGHNVTQAFKELEWE
jgi:quinoprotein relay system zinc metallohydrolase 2